MADAITVGKLVLRSTKGSELTSAEADSNFQKLEAFGNALSNLMATSLKTDGTLKDNTVGQSALQDRAVGQNELALTSAFSAQDTGAANQYQIDFTPTPGAYANGMFFLVHAVNANTGPSTLRVGALAHTKILKGGTQELVAGDIQAKCAFGVLYWDGVFHFISGSGGSSSGSGGGFSGITNFEPADLAIPAANSPATFTHGFGVYPNAVDVYLLNISTEHGYAQGDLVPLDEFYEAAGEPAFGVDITVSAVVVTPRTATVKVVKASDGSSQTITLTNWRIVCRAQLFTSLSANTFPDLNLQVANPDGAVSYGGEVFFWHHGRHDSKLYQTRWNLQTGVLNRVEAFTTENFGFNAATFRYPTDQVDRMVMVSHDGTDSKINHELLQSPYTRATLKTVATDLTPAAYKAIWVDDSPGVVNPTLYFAYSAFNAAVLTNAIPAKKIIYSGGYGAWTTHGISLNLHHASIVNVSAFTNYHTAGAAILLFQYNPHNLKRRIYVISTATGFIHIFNLLNNTTSNGTASNPLNANIAAWWPTAGGGAETTQMAMLTYEKSLAMAGLGLGWATTEREKICIEYDHSTGRELSIVASRTGANNQTGVVVRVPWKE